MNKFYEMFKKVTVSLKRRFKSFKKPYKIIIPSLIVAIILIGGIFFYVDYNKTPVLTLSNLNKPVLTIDNSQFTIKGSVDLKSDSEVLINGSKAKLNNDGSFSHKIDLSVGKNDITITVTRNGKKTTSRYTINYTPKSTEDVQGTSGVEQTSQDTTTDQGGTTKTTTTTPNTSTSTPKPAPAPAPTLTPPPATFQVSVSVSVSPTSLGTSQCSSYTFEFTGTITATAAGTVNYYWQRTGSDAGGTVPGTLVFSSAGSQYVNYSWNTNLPTDGGYRPHWAQLVVTSPNSTSSQATFSRASC